MISHLFRNSSFFREFTFACLHICTPVWFWCAFHKFTNPREMSPGPFYDSESCGIGIKIVAFVAEPVSWNFATPFNMPLTYISKCIYCWISAEFVYSHTQSNCETVSSVKGWSDCQWIELTQQIWKGYLGSLMILVRLNYWSLKVTNATETAIQHFLR